MNDRNRGMGARLVAWYQETARDLPWRRTTDPYAIWISEIMLQQTTVKTVTPRFEPFLTAFPDCESLARADEAEVLSHLQGLGYYRRFRSMKRAAEIMVEKHGGKLPQSSEALGSLPGIGEYTAGAILSIAFNFPVAAVDGNVVRVLARMFRLEGPCETVAARRKLGERVISMMPEGTASRFNQALFDLGARVCTPKSPNCRECPVRGDCRSFAEGCVDQYPAIQPRRKVVGVKAVSLLLEEQGRFFLVQRAADASRMSGFWEFPEIWIDPGSDESASLRDFVRESLGFEVEVGGVVAVATHTITHHRLSCRLHAGHRVNPTESGEGRWWSEDEICSGGHPVTTVTMKLIKSLRVSRAAGR